MGGADTGRAGRGAGRHRARRHRVRRASAPSTTCSPSTRSLAGGAPAGRRHRRHGDLRGPRRRGRGGGGARMKTARIIPCLDVDNGRVVKGVNFVDLIDAGDPVELAARYDAEGADELVFLDITASSDARDTTVEMAARVAEEVFIPFTIGGGIRSVEDARRLLRAGADKVSVNTSAVERPELISEIAEEFGTQCCVVAIDARRTDLGLRGVHPRRPDADGDRCPRLGSSRPRSSGPGRSSSRRWIATAPSRASTSTSRARSTDSRSIPVIASGGVGTLEHLVEGVLAGGADAVLAASIFHFSEHTIAEAKAVLREAGSPCDRAEDGDLASFRVRCPCDRRLRAGVRHPHVDAPEAHQPEVPPRRLGWCRRLTSIRSRARRWCDR